MTHYADDIEDVVSMVIQQNPRLSTNGIITKLKALYGIKLSPEAAHKVINRMTCMSGLREEKSNTGAIVYYYPKEA